MPHILDTSLTYLKGVGEVKAGLLRLELGLFTFRDLLHYYPFRYVDKSKFHTVADVESDANYYQIKGKIGRLNLIGQKRSQRLTAVLSDHTGEIELVWFKGIKWISDYIKPGNEYIVFGKPNAYGRMLNMPHPEIEEVNDDNAAGYGILEPVYSTTEKLKMAFLDSRGIKKLTQQLMAKLEGHIEEILSEEVLHYTKLCSRDAAFRNIHFPDTQANLKAARDRLVLEEFFFFNLKMLFTKSFRDRNVKGFVFGNVGNFLNNFYNNILPFPLTEAQKRVIKEMRRDMASGRQMNRLLQGDVGSVKP
jgi:ATP-dependent DNA helicase RecG